MIQVLLLTLCCRNQSCLLDHHDLCQYVCTDHHSKVLLLCWKTFKSLVRSLQNIARWCMCKLFLRNSSCVQICNLTESTASVARGVAALWGCGTRDAHSRNALGAHPPAGSLTTVSLRYPKERERNCLNLVKGTEKKKKKKSNFPTKFNNAQLMHPGLSFF